VKVPNESVETLERDARAVFAQYRHIFPTFEDAEYFAMLPLSARDRDLILKRTYELDTEVALAKAEWLESVSPK